MNTITIPDPKDVLAGLHRELPSFYNAACFEACPNGGRSHWRIGHHSPERGKMFYGLGDTPEEAIENVRTKLAEHDPLEKAKAEVEAAGYILTKV